jgi:hypothetical protein
MDYMLSYNYKQNNRYGEIPSFLQPNSYNNHTSF